ncbi:flagellar export protein FliJ [Sporosarcina pasteurii]|uniref:Flagellar FliJ protein n=1 Tax=Sporosarcina pasteurii TaxID=1474 RepID=A0A380BG44_SPOPA|nr:flagellar export protein FliJ [Sporosarcina pasteurii]MDS9470582.1 flagellar export protein FliJ [Sporosarcina pasteurii]QBQ05729.1 flagellar export protein FliJ [Sporosarcina pasteurii]SUJ00811.1 Chemotaxis CheF protein [Sporosarcina pasteurii]
MKPYHYRFENVLTYRELEKSETEIDYQAAVESFEQIGTELYELLKQKETTIMNQQKQMEEGFSINDIHHYMRFIDSLEKKIEQVQQLVIKARAKMQWYEQKLLERTMEVRKFEKMKEKDWEEYQRDMEYQEAQRLDELSTLTFRGKEIG